jgi:hypothetical protein
MNAHSDTNLQVAGPISACQRPLCVSCSGYSFTRARKRHEECVTLVIDLVAPVLRERVAQQPAVQFQ